MATVHLEGTGGPAFPEGSTVVRRDVLRGKVWTAAPFRVIRDTGTELVLACWPGVEILAPTTWIESQRAGNEDVRKQGIPNMAAGSWEMGRWTWRDTTLLVRFAADQYFSISQFFSAEGRSGGWYVDFVLPCHRTSFGIDTFDLLLDLVVEVDLSGYRWKDEDEYAQARRLGLIDDALHRRVDDARQLVTSLIHSRQGPFAEDWSSWRRDPSWPIPTLPNGATHG